MTIAEPTTTITDYILAVSGLVFGILLLRNAQPGRGLLWPIGFFTAAAAALVGGTYHGFRPYFDADFPQALRTATMLLIGATAAFMVSAALSSPLKRGAASTQWLRAGLVLSVAGVAIQQTGISFHSNFNHNDLYHCLQILAFYFFFKGAQVRA